MSNEHSEHPERHPEQQDVHRTAPPGDGTEPTLPLGTASWAQAPAAERHEQAPGPVTTQPADPPADDIPGRRQLRIGYLVTGLVFLGISGLWLANEVGVIEVEDLDLLVPMLLVVVGAAGLLAGLLRTARRG